VWHLNTAQKMPEIVKPILRVKFALQGGEARFPQINANFSKRPFDFFPRQAEANAARALYRSRAYCPENAAAPGSASAPAHFGYPIQQCLRRGTARKFSRPREAAHLGVAVNLATAACLVAKGYKFVAGSRSDFRAGPGLIHLRLPAAMTLLLPINAIPNALLRQ